MVGSTAEQAVIEHNKWHRGRARAVGPYVHLGTAYFRDARLAIARALSAARLRTPSFR
jgi:hypothetical protein